MIQKDVKANCFIEYDEDQNTYALVVSLSLHQLSMTLEYSDITDEVMDFLAVNDEYDIYMSEIDMLEDIERAHFERWLGKPNDSEKINLLVSVRMKMRHRAGLCKDDCILCNPDLGDDPFPDFTFKLRNVEPDGEC